MNVPIRRFGLISAAWLFAVFAVTLWAPDVSALRCLYVFPILLAVRAPQEWHLWALASAGTVLAVVGAARATPTAGQDSSFLLGAIAPAATLWLAAVLVARYRREVAAHTRTRAAEQEAEGALSQSRKALEDLKYALDQSAIVAMTDVAGTITYVNETFCRISQYSREELIGQNHRIINSGYHPREFFAAMYDTIKAGRVWREEIRNRAKDGSFYWVDTTIVPFVGNDGRPYQYVAIRHDITERKRSEAALRDQNALARLGKMAAVVAHEVRNPLAGIRGALQVITPRLPEASRERAIIGEAVSRIDTLNEIVSDLLLFARPTSPSLVPVPVARVVADTVNLFQQDPTVTDITVQVDDTDAVVTADEQQVKQVLLNLLMNGAQAMHGTGRIRVSTHEAGSWYEIRVADEGPGISPDVREHLFEPFFTTRHRGTGLGLATARRLIDAHGGTVRLECPDRGGTVAIMALPRAQHPQAPLPSDATI